MLIDVNVMKCVKMNKITLFQSGMGMFIILSSIRRIMIFLFLWSR